MGESSTEIPTATNIEGSVGGWVKDMIACFHVLLETRPGESKTDRAKPPRSLYIDVICDDIHDFARNEFLDRQMTYRFVFKKTWQCTASTIMPVNWILTQEVEAAIEQGKEMSGLAKERESEKEGARERVNIFKEQPGYQKAEELDLNIASGKIVVQKVIVHLDTPLFRGDPAIISLDTLPSRRTTVVPEIEIQIVGCSRDLRPVKQRKQPIQPVHCASLPMMEALQIFSKRCQSNAVLFDVVRLEWQPDKPEDATVAALFAEHSNSSREALNELVYATRQARKQSGYIPLWMRRDADEDLLMDDIERREQVLTEHAFTYNGMPDARNCEPDDGAHMISDGEIADFLRRVDYMSENTFRQEDVADEVIKENATAAATAANLSATEKAAYESGKREEARKQQQREGLSLLSKLMQTHNPTEWEEIIEAVENDLPKERKRPKRAAAEAAGRSVRDVLAEGSKGAQIISRARRLEAAIALERDRIEEELVRDYPAKAVRDKERNTRLILFGRKWQDEEDKNLNKKDEDTEEVDIDIGDAVDFSATVTYKTDDNATAKIVYDFLNATPDKTNRGYKASVHYGTKIFTKAKTWKSTDSKKMFRTVRDSPANLKEIVLWFNRDMPTDQRLLAAVVQACVFMTYLYTYGWGDMKTAAAKKVIKSQQDRLSTFDIVTQNLPMEGVAKLALFLRDFQCWTRISIPRMHVYYMGRTRLFELEKGRLATSKRRSEGDYFLPLFYDLLEYKRKTAEAREPFFFPGRSNVPSIRRLCATTDDAPDTWMEEQEAMEEEEEEEEELEEEKEVMDVRRAHERRAIALARERSLKKLQEQQQNFRKFFTTEPVSVSPDRPPETAVEELEEDED